MSQPPQTKQHDLYNYTLNGQAMLACHDCGRVFQTAVSAVTDCVVTNPFGTWDFTFPDPEATNPSIKVCECGGDAVGSPSHAHYCPLAAGQ